MASELELKLAATPEAINKIKELAFPGVSSQSAWENRQLNNTYFDTEHFKLREMLIGVRIRESQGQFIQTIKSSGKTIGGLHQRNEDEVILETNQLDLTLITDPYLQILVEEAVEEDGAFKACFNTDFLRTQCILTFSDGTKIEVALDQGSISAEGKQLTICEVELELLEGSAEYIFAIGRYLVKELDLTLYNASKAKRGYSLCENLSPSSMHMQVTELSQGVASEVAFEKICFSAMRHWQQHELYLNHNNAHSAVLEMYRALIFLQHIYMVFGILIPRRATHEMRLNWGWIAQAMRPIVDAAKHKRYLNNYLGEKADWDLVESQQKKINQEVEEAIQAFRNVLATPRYNLMMLNMAQWLYFKEWRNFIPEKERSKLNTPVIDFARKQLDHVLRELKRELGPKVELQAKDYFKLVAKLRRALDTGLFFGSLFDSQKRLNYRQSWMALVNAIRELQTNQYIFELQLETQPQDDAEQWLSKHNQPLLEAAAQIRRALFKENPYWA